MLDGPWHNQLATGLIVSVCTIAVLGTFWLHAELKTEQRVSEYYEGKAEAQKATDQVVSSCLALSSVERTECVREAIVAEEKRNNETRDLHAQEWMAFWALMMFGATILMTGVTVVGVVFVAKTLSVTREIGQAQVRAYVSVKPTLISNFEEGKGLQAKLTIDNKGNSPAHRLRWKAEFQKISGPLPEGGLLTITEGQTTTDLISGSAIEPTVLLGDIDRVRYNALFDKSLGENREKLYLACIVSYFDVFDRPQTTAFCAEVTGVGALRMEEERSIAEFEWRETDTHNKAT